MSEIDQDEVMNSSYMPTWDSLRTHPVPAWFRDAKFGIYTHWGIYSVPARSPNGCWYPFFMYREGSDQYQHHLRTFGGPAKFGYKDFIPRFTGERFDPDEWAEFFRLSGARFAGPVAEHHDGFSMWDTAHSEWNAARMGPRRDVVGALEKSIRSAGLRFLVAFHHVENWWFYPHWCKEFDTSDPRCTGLYGELHNLNGPSGDHWFFNQDRPSRRFLKTWEAKILEVIDKYFPDMLWFDFGLAEVPDHHKQRVLAYYYNQALERGRTVIVTFKERGLPPGCGVVDLELGGMDRLADHEWMTDTTVDDGEGWGYLEETGYKSTATLVHYLVDNVSKNGALLLNIGPKPDGTFPEQAKEVLKGIGQWLQINGEAIYGTTNWTVFGEGPHRIEKGGPFSEKNLPAFTGQDIRFTVKGHALYAILLGWPGEEASIETLKCLHRGEISSVRMLGVDQELDWSLTPEGMRIRTHGARPCDHAYVIEIVRREPYPQGIRYRSLGSGLL